MDASVPTSRNGTYIGLVVFATADDPQLVVAPSSLYDSVHKMQLFVLRSLFDVQSIERLVSLM